MEGTGEEKDIITNGEDKMKIPELTIPEATICTLWTYVLYDQIAPNMAFSPLLLAGFFTLIIIGEKMG